MDYSNLTTNIGIVMSEARVFKTMDGRITDGNDVSVMIEIQKTMLRWFEEMVDGEIKESLYKTLNKKMAR